jgi:lipoprotein-anchoring transpeptidase ErfK/SrfK
VRFLLWLLGACLWCLIGTSSPPVAKAQTAFGDWSSGQPHFYRPSRSARRYYGQRVPRAQRSRQTRYRYRRRLPRRAVNRSPVGNKLLARQKKPRTKTTSLGARQSNAGPIQVVVSLNKQKLTVYDSGRLVGSTQVSTGRDGYETPTGIFSIIQKRRQHYSNLYDGASMPFMQRLTWSGIALHAGVVPGYPASHGCVRLPPTFARDLFRYTRRRSHVIVVEGDERLRPIAHRTLFRPVPAGDDTNLVAQSQPKTVQLAMNDTESSSTRTDAQPVSGVLPPPRPEPVSAPSTSSPVRAALNVYDDVDNLDLRNERATRRAAKSTAPLRLLITKRSERDYLREAQRLLAELGFDPGPADGLLGPRTAAAIRAFQQEQGLTVTGQAGRRLYAKLRAATGRAPPFDGILRVRQNGQEIYTSELNFADEHLPLGAHLYTLINLNNGAGTATWMGVTVKAGRHGSNRAPQARSASGNASLAMRHALDRVEIPAHARLVVEDLLTPGSSLIITDGGHDRETGVDTDFIVLAGE